MPGLQEDGFYRLPYLNTLFPCLLRIRSSAQVHPLWFDSGISLLPPPLPAPTARPPESHVSLLSKRWDPVEDLEAIMAMP